MTLERAADCVSSLVMGNEQAALDLYMHFDNYFGLTQRDLEDNGERSFQFFAMCGFTTQAFFQA